jgi:GNAT superfamily N-acetyltransferase
MLRIRLMTVADLPFGMHLKQQAGWNQTEADWRRFLDLQPDGCFVAEQDGTPVGTTAAFLFGPVAWVAVVLVEQSVRGRGIGTALVQHALAFLDGRGVRSVRLDATPLGRAIYERLGFAAEHTLVRYEGRLPPEATFAPEVEPVGPEDLPELLRLDAAVSGADRTRLLGRLYEEQPDAFRMVRRSGTVTGFVASRPGSRATQIGPCAAADAATGEHLLGDAARRLRGQRVFIDVPLRNRPALSVVERMGLTAQRELLRMGRGEPARERVERLWASSGPEKG